MLGGPLNVNFIYCNGGGEGGMSLHIAVDIKF